MNTNTRKISSVLLSLSVIASSSWLTVPAQAQNVVASTQLFGFNEVSPNSSLALGSAILTVNPLTGIYDLSLFVTGIGMTDLLGVGPNSSPVHIHSAPVGVNGPIVVDTGYLASISPLGSDGFKLDVRNIFGGVQGALNGPSVMDNLADLSGGELYLNVHTTDFPGGEIRGQFNLVVIPEPGTVVLGALFVGGMFALRRRRQAV